MKFINLLKNKMKKESISNVKDIREIKQKIKKVSNMGINIIKKGLENVHFLLLDVKII